MVELIAWINGVMVQGSPEEIEHYRQLSAEKKTSTHYNLKDDIPEHVKKYGESFSYELKNKSRVRAWF